MRKSSIRKIPRPAKVTVRMPRSLRTRLGAWARATGLSLNFLIVAILKDTVATRRARHQ